MKRATTDISSKIVDAIVDNYDGDGDFNIEEAEIGEGVLADITGSIWTDSYVEDDFHCGYCNGTGAWVTYAADCSVSDIDCYTYDKDGNKLQADVIYDYAQIEHKVEDYLRT